jgi:hypothetical protein
MASRQERKMAGSGGRFILIGAPLVAIGIVLVLLLDGTAQGIGLAVLAFGLLPIVVGVVLLVSAGVEQRSRKDKPYA